MNGNGIQSVNGNSHKCDEKNTVEGFMKDVFELCMTEGWEKMKDRETPVINFKSPKELDSILDLEIQNKPESHERLLKSCKDVFQYSVKTGHPRFFNQLYAGMDPYALSGQIITDILNPSIYTYEVSPVFVLMEKYLLQKFCDIIGYEEGDGTFSPGGSYSNMLGMNLARYHTFPDIKTKGMQCLPSMVGFCSSHSHYSNKKNASLLGIGSDQLIAVGTDRFGRMDVADLKKKINQSKDDGSTPFVVIATAGTTVYGAFDPIDEIASVCKEHNVWLHVDAAWGGGVMLSEKLRHRCKGIHRADSVTWNPHKMMMAPQQCCVFVTKHKTVLNDCHSVHVPYLFQKDKTLYDSSFDVGSKIIQCGRKVDSLKLWLMWKAMGNVGMKNRIEKSFENAKYLTELVAKRDGFKLVLENPECTNVCFWYIPARLREREFDLNDKNFCREMAAVAPILKERMTEKGRMLCGYQPIDDLPNFFRMVVISDKVTKSDMEFVVEEIEKLGHDL